MPFGSLTVVVILVTGDPGDGSTPSLDRALRSAMGDRAEVAIHVVDDHVTAEGSTFVARLEWSDHERRAVLRTSDGAHSAEREIRFDASDAPAERGRTLGFALASMVPDELLKEPPPPPERPSPPPPTTPPVVGRTSETEPAPVPKRAPRFSIELLGQGAVGVGGTASGLGGTAGARWLLPHGFFARLAFGLRVGEIPSAQATSQVLLPSIGAGWSIPVSEAFRIGGRVDAILMHQYVSHFSADDPEPDGRGRFLPAGAARVEGSFRVAESTTLSLAFGPEIALGTTHLYVENVETTPIPPLRFVGEVGISVAF